MTIEQAAELLQTVSRINNDLRVIMVFAVFGVTLYLMRGLRR